MRRIATLALAILIAAPLVAGTLAGVSMPESSKAGDHPLVLNGMGLRSKAMFKVYVAGLYLPEKQGDWQAVLAADTPRQTLMQWMRSVDKGKICEGWKEGLEANTPNPSPDVKAGFDTLCSYTDDTRTGDKFLFTYIPGKGTEVAINGKVKGDIPGKGFADALWACWIGAHPGPGESFRDALMGKSS